MLIVVVAVVVVVIVVAIVVIAVVVVVLIDKRKRIHGEIRMVNCNTGAVEDIVSIRSFTVPFFVAHIVFFSITAPFHALRKIFTCFTIKIVGIPKVVLVSGDIAKVCVYVEIKAI